MNLPLNPSEKMLKSFKNKTFSQCWATKIYYNSYRNGSESFSQ